MRLTYRLAVDYVRVFIEFWVGKESGTSDFTDVRKYVVFNRVLKATRFYHSRL